jgi:hypothetical protein
MFITPPPRDQENNILQGYISGIPNILNIATVSGTWNEIITPYETKQLLIQPAQQVDWDLSYENAGAYFSFFNGAALKIDIAVTSGTLCWVRPSENVTFQILIGV